MAFFWALMARTALDKLNTSDTEKSFYEIQAENSQVLFRPHAARTETHKRAMLSGPDNLMDLNRNIFLFEPADQEAHFIFNLRW